MRKDAKQIPNDSVVQSDVCVVGSGAAGITVARELALAGVNVLLLEAGSEKQRPEQVDLYRGTSKSKNHGPLHLYRQRRLGGTTAVWGGRSAPYETIDLEDRSHVPNSGWPITRDDLNDAYVKAHEYLDLGPFSYSAAQSFPASEQLPVECGPEIVMDPIWRFSLPTNFWRKYRSFFSSHPKADVIVNGSCTEIVTTPNGDSVDYIRVMSSPGRQFTVRANAYVLAMGGLEVTRLLLASTSVQKTGIGNAQDLLGRFYLSHLTGNAGTIHFERGYGEHFWKYVVADGIYCKRLMRLTHDAQRRNGLLNLAVTATHMEFQDPSHGSGVLSSVYLAKRLLMERIPPEFSRELTDSKYQHFLKHVKNVVFSPLEMMRFTNTWTRKRLLASRKLPAVMFRSGNDVYTLHFDAEQSPNFESRVTLDDQRDEFGVPRLVVDWRMNRGDAESVSRSIELIAGGLESGGVARLKIRPDIANDVYAHNSVGSHHIGTTRMGSSPSTGVVDSECRVFGVRNLYVASSSVFPTTSYVNPTLQIVAIAIRIAAHIARSSGSVK
ncbi:MAG: GMC family oxidoreductase [Candidatus Acidiferrales bacterium]|jgi:choline dehydrogenase-like flavoprotein